MNQRSTTRPHLLRTFARGDGTLGCGECCWGDRCDDPTHFFRRDCPYCKGTGAAIWVTEEPINEVR